MYKSEMMPKSSSREKRKRHQDEDEGEHATCVDDWDGKDNDKHNDDSSRSGNKMVCIERISAPTNTCNGNGTSNGTHSITIVGNSPISISSSSTTLNNTNSNTSSNSSTSETKPPKARQNNNVVGNLSRNARKSSQEIEIIVIDDSDDEDGNDGDLPNNNGRNSGIVNKSHQQSDNDEVTVFIPDSDNKNAVLVTNDQDITIGEPSIFYDPNAACPPNTIDTGFNGNATKQKVPSTVFNHGFNTITVLRSAFTIRYLPIIWPKKTPIPAVGGGFYEQLSNSKSGHQTYSRVARLAGTIQIHVALKPVVANLCLSTQRGRWILAEKLYETQRYSPTAIMSKRSRDILKAIFDLNDKDNTFGERCLYVVARAPIVPSPLSNCYHKVAGLKFYVYFRRAIFGLSAHPHIQTLLNALEPLPGSEKWKPCRQVALSTNRFQRSPCPVQQGNQTKSNIDPTCSTSTTSISSASKSKFDFSLPGILWANENTGISNDTIKQSKCYKGVQVQLRDYQLESVTWMRNQENLDFEVTGGGVSGLNGYFWERRSLGDGEYYYYFPLGGHVLLEPPPTVSGGILSEEMGLGKTVITIDLICSDADRVPRDSGGTLIVLPVSLLVQWEEEIQSKAPHLKFFTYNGDNVISIHNECGTVSGVMKQLMTYDIVLTTMSKITELTSNRNRGHVMKNCLSKVSWHRLVVDECQFLKNNTTAIARAAASIDATHRWMLSGTPLTNKLDDLRGELSLLRVWPFTLGASDDGWQDHFWSNDIKKNWDNRNESSISIINKLMKAVSMRHSSLQTRAADGSPLVSLPPRNEHFVAVTMDSKSSCAFVNKWMEALAVEFLNIFGRFDIQVNSLILKLQQLVTVPGLLLDNLEQIDSNLSQVKNLSRAKRNKGIRVVDLRTAIMEEKKKDDSPILPELVLFAKGDSAFTCNYCQRVSFKPSYMKCNHSICAGCCDMLLRATGYFPCPVCSLKIQAEDVLQVSIPEMLSSRKNMKSSSEEAIDVDLDEAVVENILADHRLAQTVNLPSATETPSSLPESKQTAYDVRIEEASVNFQDKGEGYTVHTFESLKNISRPALSLESEVEVQQTIASLTNGEEMETLVRHALASENERSPKLKAICDTIQSIRDESLEAKICIFSSYSRVLDELEEILDNVRYSVEYNMNTNVHLLPGQSVTLSKTGEKGLVVKKEAVQKVSEGEEDIPISAWEMPYKIELLDGTKTVANRNDIEVDSVVLDNVSSNLIRKDSSTPVFSRNGSDCRFVVNESVESKRPSLGLGSTELHVGYTVDILPTSGTGETKETGKIVFVHTTANGEVSYDILPDGYKQVMRNGSMEAIRKEVMKEVESCRVIDKGFLRSYLPAKIKGIRTKHELSETNYVRNAETDPFKNAIGFVRIDGHAGSATQRGKILETFKRDPMTSICLLTKRTAGVGINLTDANHVILVEPSIDGHDESQSIARVHRIGQTRNVLVKKFYAVGSVEERILKRRQQRGDLAMSINTVIGSDSGEESKGKKQSEVLTSKAMTFEDLQLLLGVQ